MKITVKEIVEVTKGTILFSNNSKDDVCITSVSSNSKEISEGALFLAIAGERVDGHEFVKGAFEQGAAAALVCKDIDRDNVPDNKVCIKVQDTLSAIQKLAAWYRRKFDIPVAAVTGSVGKTTTKEMIACALESGMNVLKTRGNMNSQLGVALMMFKLEKDHDIAVIEMGISEPGEMHRLSEIACPEIAVITNIGVSHIGQLKSQENIRKEKLDVIRGFAKNGKLILPANDELLNREDAFCEHSLTKESFEIMKNVVVVYYGENDNCSYKAVNIYNTDEGVTFTAVIDEKGENRRYHVHLSVLGIHNVYNALAAIAVADNYKLDIDRVVKNIEKYSPIAMRGQIFSHDGITVIDDTYNASPDSMKSGLSVLWDRKCDGKKYAVLADVLELGEASEKLHRGIGSYISSCIITGKRTDCLVTVGCEAAYIADEARRELGNDNKCIVKDFKTKHEALEYLKQHTKSGDLVFVKGSRGMQMDKLVKGLLYD